MVFEMSVENNKRNAIIMDGRHFNQHSYIKRHPSVSSAGICTDGKHRSQEDSAVYQHEYEQQEFRKSRQGIYNRSQGARRAAAAVLAAALIFTPAGSALPPGVLTSSAQVTSGVRPTVDEAYYVKTESTILPTAQNRSRETGPRPFASGTLPPPTSTLRERPQSPSKNSPGLSP